MILLDIQDHTDPGKEMKEAVRIFTCLRDKSLRISDADIAADRFKDAAYRDRRIQFPFQEDVRNHGCGRCLSVCSGYGDRHIVVFHELSEKFCTCQHGDLLCNSLHQFRISLVDRSRVYDTVNAGSDIPGFLPVVDMCSFGFELLRKRRFFGIRARNREAFLQQDLGEPAHADPANSDKMNMDRFLKINLIHRYSSSLIFCFL